MATYGKKLLDISGNVILPKTRSSLVYMNDNTTVEDTIKKLIPVGIVIPYTGSTAPSGWLLCQGQAISRTTYSSLFSVISTKYGSGNGSTTFNLPDLRGNTVVGVDSSNGLGTKAGEKTHVLGINEIPRHTHRFLLCDGGAGSGSAYAQVSRSKVNNNTQVPTFEGNDLAHNNMQPSIYLNYIIKY